MLPDPANRPFGSAGLRYGHTMDQLAASMPKLHSYKRGIRTAGHCLLCHAQLVRPTLVRTSKEGVACEDCFQLHWRN
jgi:hypothetical protein